MKIEFITQDDSRYILPFFDEFVRCYGGQFEIGMISVCPTMGKRPRWQLARELFWLYGAQGFLQLSAGAVFDRLLGLRELGKDAKRYYTIAQLCRAYKIPFLRVGNPNDSVFCGALQKRRSEVLVSVACPFILKEPLLRLPPRGCINIHHAPLPHYKGMMPTFWQMYHGKKTVGVTVHYMEPAIDAGDALLSEQLEIEPDESLDHLIRRSKRHGAHVMAKALRGIFSGHPTFIPLNHSEGSYFTFPTRQEIREFQRGGLRAI
jgi:methionyl-tRNA formyltransferase